MYKQAGDIIWILTDTQGPVTQSPPCVKKGLSVYYYLDADAAYDENKEVRRQRRHTFSKNGALDYDLDCAHDFCGTPDELETIKKELKRREIEDDIACSVFTFDNIDQILNECPPDFEFIIIKKK